MIFNKSTAKKTAEVLLQINAIKLNPKNPFTWASGWKSPIYCDNRLVLSFPAVRNYIKEEIAKNIELEFGKPDVIAGVATGAIGIGALVAEYRKLMRAAKRFICCRGRAVQCCCRHSLSCGEAHGLSGPGKRQRLW